MIWPTVANSQVVHKGAFVAQNLNSSPITISGLQGDVYDYDITIKGQGSSGDPDMRITFNSDGTANYRNYKMQGEAASGTATIANSDTAIVIADGWSSNRENVLKGRILGMSGDERYLSARIAAGNGANEISRAQYGYWKNTANEITSITIDGSLSQNYTGEIIIRATPKDSNQEGWELVEEQSVVAQNINTTPVDFTGLDLDTDEEYRVTLEGNNDAVTPNFPVLVIQCNNDAVAANYINQRLYNEGGILKSQRLTNIIGYNPTVDSLRDVSKMVFDCVLKGTSGSERLWRGTCSKRDTVQQAESAAWWTNTVDNVTSLRITAAITNTTTATFRLYRRRKKQATSDFEAFETIHSESLSAADFSAGSTITVAGDDLKQIKIEGSLKNTSGDIEIRMQFNGDAGANYDEQLLKGDTATPSAAAITRNHIVLAKLQNGNESEFTASLFPETGTERPVITDNNYDENAIEKLIQFYTNTVTEITSIKVFASTSNGVTGDIKVSRLRQ